MTEAFITPRLVRWARERHHLSLVEAAEKLHIGIDRLEAWENGKGRPTIRQAQELARRLRVPFGYLYLSSPPEESLPIPDLRTVKDQPALPPSADFYDLLSDVISKQEWYREYLEAEGSESLAFVGRYTVQADVETVAEDIRQTIGITQQMRDDAGNPERFLRNFIRNSEDAGILVLRSGIVGNNTQRVLEVTEFRGLVISDNLAPLVFINSRDARTAQVFTLGHEIAHIWVGQTGVSNPKYRNPNEANEIEQYCNAVAAEVLAPKADFLESWNLNKKVDENVQNLRARYRVSWIVVLRQALNTSLIDHPTYWEHYDNMINTPPTPSTAKGGDFYNNLLARNSVSLTHSVMSALAQGRTTYSEAASLLNVRLTTLTGIADSLYGSQPTLG